VICYAFLKEKKEEKKHTHKQKQNENAKNVDRENIFIVKKNDVNPAEHFRYYYLLVIKISSDSRP
jgi:hypothetical protein